MRSWLQNALCFGVAVVIAIFAYRSFFPADPGIKDELIKAKSIVLAYTVMGSKHVLELNDAELLNDLAESFSISFVERNKVTQRPHEAELQVLSGGQISHFKVFSPTYIEKSGFGGITLSSDHFYKLLCRTASDNEGRTIDIAVDNEFRAERVARNRQILEGLQKARAFATVSKKSETIISAGLVVGIKYQIMQFDSETGELKLYNPEGRNPIFYHDDDKEYFVGKNAKDNVTHENNGMFWVGLEEFTRIFDLHVK